MSAWLTQHVDGTTAPFTFERIAGGRSNLTVEVTDGAGRRLVVRRPPLGETLQSAHDMEREHRIISSLWGSGVPVPRALGLGHEADGAKFYVMEFVDGVVLRDVAEVERTLDKSQRLTAANALIDVLADLHALEPDQVGLGTLGRRDGYVERQLRRWQGQWEQSKTRELPVVDEVHRRLVAGVPVQERTAIVHGDFRLDNMIFADDGSCVRAVLDWELSTLGDPRADLGLLMVYWAMPNDGVSNPLIGAPTAAPGFPGSEALAERYVKRTQTDLVELAYFTALGCWKLACIAEGVHSRFRTGAMGDRDGLALDDLRDQVEALAQQALELIEADE